MISTTAPKRESDLPSSSRPRFKGMTVDHLLSLAAGEPLPEQVACRMLSAGGTVREGVFKDGRSTGRSQEER